MTALTPQEQIENLKAQVAALEARNRVLVDRVIHTANQLTDIATDLLSDAGPNAKGKR